MKKAQTATEYMIILAVVIIIALIVVGVLGGIPGLGTGARSRASASYWASADIAITSYAVQIVNPTTADITLKIRNNKQNTIVVSAVNLSDSVSASASVAGSNLISSSITLGPGTEKTITSTGNANIDLCDGKSAGDAWTSNVIIKYQDDETGATYLFKGDGNKLEGVCAQ